MDFFLDFLHIAVGILIVVLAVFSFLNPDRNLVLFPVIFMLAAILNLVNGWVKIKRSGRDRKKQLSGAGLLLFGISLVLLSAVSALSIWR
ncbi:MAG: hypothetical protein HFG49_06085 [Lachnospiraceae bacterium]|nr:hypothetical protein [Lachnospiraceae bacterium]